MGAGDKNKPDETGGGWMDDRKKEILKLLEDDAKDAGWRLAGKQFVKLTREPLVAFLSKQLGGDETIRQKVGAFLDTDLGEAFMAGMLSMGLSMLPDTTGEVPKRLARELRTSAMTNGGDVVADLLMGPLRQVAVLYLQGTMKEKDALPDKSKDNVPAPKEVSATVSQLQPQTVGSGGSKSS